MYFVYFLQSFDSGRFYIGRTSDLSQRLRQHRAGKVWTTSRMGWVELIGYEAFRSEKDAIRRERYFKTSKGRSTLWLMYRNSMTVDLPRTT